MLLLRIPDFQDFSSGFPIFESWYCTITSITLLLGLPVLLLLVLVNSSHVIQLLAYCLIGAVTTTGTSTSTSTLLELQLALLVLGVIYNTLALLAQPGGTSLVPVPAR